MNHAKRKISPLQRISAGVGLVVLLGAVALFLPRRLGLPAQNLNGNTVSITITRYLYHTGIIMPVRTAVYDWSGIFPCLAGKRFVEIGWGDRDFYMSGSVTLPLALQALFRSQAAVVNVNGMDTLPSDAAFAGEAFAQKTIRLSEENYMRMVAQMLTSVELHEKKAVFLREGFWGASSAFYEATTAQTGAYSIVNNCNVWNSRALDAADVTVPLWAGIPHPLLWMVSVK
jgi:uncharacterized protein (TIGR02117 family)